MRFKLDPEIDTGLVPKTIFFMRCIPALLPCVAFCRLEQRSEPAINLAQSGKL